MTQQNVSTVDFGKLRRTLAQVAENAEEAMSQASDAISAAEDIKAAAQTIDDATVACQGSAKDLYNYVDTVSAALSTMEACETARRAHVESLERRIETLLEDAGHNAHAHEQLSQQHASLVTVNEALVRALHHLQGHVADIEAILSDAIRTTRNNPVPPAAPEPFGEPARRGPDIAA